VSASHDEKAKQLQSLNTNSFISRRQQFEYSSKNTNNKHRYCKNCRKCS